MQCFAWVCVTSQASLVNHPPLFRLERSHRPGRRSCLNRRFNEHKPTVSPSPPLCLCLCLIRSTEKFHVYFSSPASERLRDLCSLLICVAIAIARLYCLLLTAFVYTDYSNPSFAALRAFCEAKLSPPSLLHRCNRRTAKDICNSLSCSRAVARL